MIYKLYNLGEDPINYEGVNVPSKHARFVSTSKDLTKLKDENLAVKQYTDELPEYDIYGDKITIEEI